MGICFVDRYELPVLKGNIKYMKIKKIALFLSAFLSIISCRQTELKEGSPSDPLRDIRGLLGPYAFSLFSGTFGPPLNMQVSDGSLFFFSAYDSESIFETTDGINFSKKNLSLPNCSKVSGNAFVACRIVGISKHNGVYQTLGVKQSGTSNPRTVLSSIFYYATGTSLDNLLFKEITDPNFSSTEILFNGLPSASNNQGFAIYLKSSDSLGKVCALGSGASSWVCIQNPSGNPSEGFVANLNGTLIYDRYYRWNGASFTDTTVTRTGQSRSGFYSSGRTLITTGTNIRYTSTDPSVWSQPIATSTSTITGGLSSGEYILIGSVGERLYAVGIVYDGSGALFYFSSEDNGMNWTKLGTISIPNSEIVRNIDLSIPVIFQGNFFIRIQGNTSSNFAVKYFKSKDMSNWTEVLP